MIIHCQEEEDSDNTLLLGPALPVPRKDANQPGMFSVPVPTICISSSLEASYRDKKGDEEASDLV